MSVTVLLRLIAETAPGVKLGVSAREERRSC